MEFKKTIRWELYDLKQEKKYLDKIYEDIYKNFSELEGAGEEIWIKKPVISCELDYLLRQSHIEKKEFTHKLGQFEMSPEKKKKIFLKELEKAKKFQRSPKWANVDDVGYSSNMLDTVRYTLWKPFKLSRSLLILKLFKQHYANITGFQSFIWDIRYQFYKEFEPHYLYFLNKCRDQIQAKNGKS